MIRVLVIECLLGVIGGAIAFRLAWATSRNRVLSWGVVLALAVLAFFLFPDHPDRWMVREFGGVLGSPTPGPLVRALHGFCPLAGAGLSWMVLLGRIRAGLEEERRFKDFP
jgi:hypothetical protein